MSRKEKKRDLIQEQMLWLLSLLWDQDDQVELFGLSHLVDELDRLIQTEAKAKEMLTDYMANHLSDLSIISECLRQLSLYQPWANNFEDAMIDRKDSITQEWEQRNKPWRGLHRAFDRQTSYARLGDPSDGKFYYPVDRRRTTENTEAMRQAESKLDMFWKRIDQLIHDHVGNLDGTAVGRAAVPVTGPKTYSGMDGTYEDFLVEQEQPSR